MILLKLQAVCGFQRSRLLQGCHSTRLRVRSSKLWSDSSLAFRNSLRTGAFMDTCKRPSIHSNSQEKAIQFTVETEVDSRLPFLDVLVTRRDGRLSFSAYRKDTHTGRYLNFQFVHPDAHKRSVAASLLNRTNRICTTAESRSTYLDHVRGDHSASGYPTSFLSAVERRLYNPARPANPRPRKRAAIPYVPGISETLSHVLRSYDVEVAHVPVCKLRQALVGGKDRLPRESFPGVVYKIPCADCDYAYLGESGNFKQRLRQHQKDVEKKRTVSKALAEHTYATGHKIH